ncbi:MAG: NAD(P)H-dependent glycerol-3-phosphate dehydrogenase [Mariprofundales bacterium]
MNITVLGAGCWGTALALSLARNGHRPLLLAHTAAIASDMQLTRQNRPFLPNIPLPDSIRIAAVSTAHLLASDTLVMVLPCYAISEYTPVLQRWNGTQIIVASKGLHPEHLQRADAMVSAIVGDKRTALLSGPSFALEVAEGLPVAVTMAANDIDLAKKAADFFVNPVFRVYTSTDIVGVGLAGALKNVMAIAAGITDGLQLGHNAVAALVTRGLHEMTRLVIACGGKQETMYGLSGLGDLLLTCTGSLSRNRRFGQCIAQGLNAEQAAIKIGQVVEGARTVKAAHTLAIQNGVDAPIIQAVYDVLYVGITPNDAVSNLLQRPQKNE